MGEGRDPGSPRTSGVRDRESPRTNGVRDSGSSKALWTGVAAAVAVVVGVVGVVTQVGGGGAPDDDAVEAEPAGAGSDDTEDTQDTEWDDVRGDLGVSPAQFRQRWNDAVAAAGTEHRLESLVPTNSSGVHDLPASEQKLEGLARVEVVLAPDEDLVVMATLDRASPKGTAQRNALFAAMQAGVSAATGLSPEASAQRLRGDLDIAPEGMAAEHHSATARVEGVDVGVYAAHWNWEFFVEKEPE